MKIKTKGKTKQRKIKKKKESKGNTTEKWNSNKRT